MRKKSLLSISAITFIVCTFSYFFYLNNFCLPKTGCLSAPYYPSMLVIIVELLFFSLICFVFFYLVIPDDKENNGVRK